MNRASLRSVAVVVLPLVVTGGLFALRSRTIVPHVESTPPWATSSAPATAASMPTPRVATTVADFYGAYVFADEKPFQIEELVWGIQVNGDIGFAVLHAQAADGKRIDWDHPERYARIALTPEELHDAYMVDGKTGLRYKVDAIRYGVFKNGHMGVFAWSGWDDKGAATGFGDMSAVLAVQCCGLYTDTTCTSAACSGTCPGPTNCVCTSTATPPGAVTGSCTLGSAQVCRGKCQDTEPCYTFKGSCNGSVADCKCIKTVGGGGGGGDGDGSGG